LFLIDQLAPPQGERSRRHGDWIPVRRDAEGVSQRYVYSKVTDVKSKDESCRHRESSGIKVFRHDAI